MRGLGWLGAAALAVACLLIVPATSGAWTASLKNADSAGVSQWYSCAAAVSALGPSMLFDWNLAEPATTGGAQDASPANLVGTYAGAHAVSTIGSTGGCTQEQTQVASFDGTSSWVGSGSSTLPSGFATGFSIAAWVRTPVGWSGGGDIVMLCANAASASSCTSRDYRMYLTSTGAVVFGVADQNAYTDTVRTAGSVNDGAWHHVVGTLSGTAGVHVYLDGVDVTSTATALSTYFNPPYASTSISAASIKGSRTTTTTGYWRVGMGDGAPNWLGHNPFSSSDVFVYLKGQLTGVTVYKATLTSDQVASLAASGR